MAIGAQPTTTSVVISDGSGQTGTIPAANEKAAGVMTAVMYQQLNDLLRWRVGVDTGSDVGGPVDIITRTELNQALQALRQAPAQQALTVGNQFDQRRMLARMDALETAQTQALSLPSPQVLSPVYDADAVTREEIDQLKADMSSVSNRLAALEQGLNAIIDHLPTQLNTAHVTADPAGAYASLASRVSRVEETLRVIVEESIATAQAEGAA